IVLQPVACGRFHDHPTPVRLQRLPDMLRCSDGIPHVVQTIEEGHEIEIVAGELARQSNFEPRVRGDTVLLRMQSGRSEEHTSELQSLMRKSYAGFCLKK